MFILIICRFFISFICRHIYRLGISKDGYFLRFPAEEVSEKKKGAVGVRGIKLKKDDELETVYLFEEGTETKVSYRDREVTLNRLKPGKRDTNGTKARG